MGLGSYLLLLSSVVIGIAFYLKYNCKPPNLDEYKKDHYWGLGDIPKKSILNEEINKFKINISSEVLDDLKIRLQRTRFFEGMENLNFKYGMEVSFMKNIVDYWLNKYDWKKQELILNKYDHFKTKIEGIDIHFVHVKPKPKDSVKTLPLLMIHGWPGSFFEMYKIIPFLTEEINGTAFELVIPSLPGYGFSEMSHKPGLNSFHISRLLVKLMQRLGHKKFYYHGGDWGSLIGLNMAKIFPERLYGIHITLLGIPLSEPMIAIKSIIGYFFPSLIYDNPKTDSLILQKLFKTTLEETGYLHLQSTKPDTLGFAMSDSPVGLAAYILEKFTIWTEKDRSLSNNKFGLTNKFTLDELLTNVMIYWLTNCATSSFRLYKESIPHLLMQTSILHMKIPKMVPVGVSIAENEIIFGSCPKALAKDQIENLVHYEYLVDTGHFAAFENPSKMANEIRKFISKC